MIIEIINGIKKLTHPSGHVDTYTISDIEKHRDKKQRRIDDLNLQVIDLNWEIAEMQNSLGG